jgi:hypothetical protein
MTSTNAVKMPKFCRSGIDDDAAVAMKDAQVVSEVMSMASPARR